MKTLEYVIDHYEEFEEDTFLDSRWTNRFLDFLPSEEWGKYGFKIKAGVTHTPIEWTEENILKQLKRDVEFGKEKAEEERGISSELMAMVVNAWCKVLENGLNLDGDDGWYHHRQFDIVAEHYGWQIGEQNNKKGKRCNMDLISREDAIRWVKTECNPYRKSTLDFESGKKVIEHLEQLPSAQPCTEAELQKIQELEQAELEKAFELGKAEANKWIPCDKGEPDEDTECWVTVKTTDALYRGNFTKRYGERRNKGFITSDGFMWWNTALAWMPIYEPEPYNAESEE